MVNIDKIKSLSREKGITIAFICSKVKQGRGYLNNVVKNKKPPQSKRKGAVKLFVQPFYYRLQNLIY